MNPASEALRRAADVLDDHVVSDKALAIYELMALHIIRSCGDANSYREARLLMRLLDS